MLLFLFFISATVAVNISGRPTQLFDESPAERCLLCPSTLTHTHTHTEVFQIQIERFTWISTFNRMGACSRMYFTYFHQVSLFHFFRIVWAPARDEYIEWVWWGEESAIKRSMWMGFFLVLPICFFFQFFFFAVCVLSGARALPETARYYCELRSLYGYFNGFWSIKIEKITLDCWLACLRPLGCCCYCLINIRIIFLCCSALSRSLDSSINLSVDACDSFHPLQLLLSSKWYSWYTHGLEAHAAALVGASTMHPRLEADGTKWE